MGKQPTRAKGWVFTINNYNDAIESKIKSLVLDGTATYVTYGR